MFISKNDKDKLGKRIDTLEEYAENDYKKLKELEKFKNKVGNQKTRGFFDISFWTTGKSEKTPDDLTLWETVQGIMDALELEVKSTSAKQAIVKKPIKKVTKKVKKAKK